MERRAALALWEVWFSLQPTFNSTLKVQEARLAKANAELEGAEAELAKVMGEVHSCSSATTFVFQVNLIENIRSPSNYREADKTSGGRPGPRLIKQANFLIWTSISNKSVLKLLLYGPRIRINYS